ncbi:MAG: hypothetical protein M3P43_05680 [Actinomycetota bacterium]|nr:hypothetical protein [Actinomycetota bacterium]
MTKIRSKPVHLLAMIVVVAAVVIPGPSIVASAHQPSSAPTGRAVHTKMSQPRLQRVAVTNVRQLAARAAAGGGLSSNLGSEAGPWIDFEHETQGEASSGEGAPAPGNTASVVNENNLGWEGLTHADQRLAGGGNQFSLEPPDQGLCVGNVSPNDPSLGPEVVESVNDALVFYDAAAEQFTTPISIPEFFGLPPSIDRTTGTFGPFVSDPKCYFDPDTQRWFHTVLVITQDPVTGELKAPAFVYIAVSTSSEALGSYLIYRINATDRGHPDCPCFGDQPLIGADKNGFYVSTAEYDLKPFGAHFNGPQIYAMSKQRLENGHLGHVVHISAITHTSGDRTTGTVQPAASPDGVYDTGANGTEYFMSGFDCLTDEVCAIAPGSFDQITVWALIHTRSLRDEDPNLKLTNVDLTVGTYASPVPQVQKDGPRPLGTIAGEPVPRINPNDSRMNQVVFADGSLWGGINTAVDPGPRDGIEYFVVDPSVVNGTVAASVHAEGYVAVADAFLSFPSVGVNGDGQGVIAITLMGPNDYPSAAQIAIDATGTHGPVEIVRQGFRPEDGFTCYEAFIGAPTVCRWGDYSASVAGPDGTIYSATEMISDDSRTLFANWSTFIWPTTPGA